MEFGGRTATDEANVDSAVLWCGSKDSGIGPFSQWVVRFRKCYCRPWTSGGFGSAGWNK
jgi:hypothetical protein